MIRNRYVVLRDNGGTLQSLGPTAPVYESERAAEIDATLMASRFSAQAFVVVRVIGEYKFEGKASARKLRLVEPFS